MFSPPSVCSSKQQTPKAVEEVKWRRPSNPDGVAVWSHGGNICTGETYKDKVKITFFKGASLDDPSGVFNAGFGGNTRRAIDLYEGHEIDEAAFKSLIPTAVALISHHLHKCEVTSGWAA